MDRKAEDPTLETVDADSGGSLCSRAEQLGPVPLRRAKGSFSPVCTERVLKDSSL